MMRILTKTIGVSTKGHTDIIDITGQVGACLHSSELRNGNDQCFHFRINGGGNNH